MEPDVGGPRSPIDQWIALDASPWSDRPDRRGREAAVIAPDRREAEPPSGPTPVRLRLDLVGREEAQIAICDVIAAWRAAERELAGLGTGGPEAARVEAEIVGLRALHHRLFEERARRSSSALGDLLSSWSASASSWFSPAASPVTA